MTEDEARDLSETAHGFMPKSSELQVKLLRLSLCPFGCDDALEAIGEHAQESEFISVPAILRKIRAKSSNAGAEERQRKEQAAAIERRRQIEREKADTDKSVTAARTFCESHPDRLDEWRAQIVAEMPHLGRLTEGKKTLQSTALVCAIYSRFGKVPVECGL